MEENRQSGGSNAGSAQRPKKRVTRKQLRRRRIGGLIVLLVIIFLLSSGCASCIRCACGSGGNSEENTVRATGVTSSSAVTSQTITESIMPTEQLLNDLPSSHKIEVTAINQKPELPTGDEITSLAMVLQHLGYDVNKEILARDYLRCAERGEATFSQAFIGSPFEEDGMGCFAPVVVDAAQRYISSQGGGKNVKTLNADNFEDVLLRVASDYPVLVWINRNLELRKEEYCFTVYSGGSVTMPAVTTAPAAGFTGTGVSSDTAAETTTSTVSLGTSKQDVYWIPNATCVVLTGYDMDNGTVTVIDPLQGEVTYEMGMFKTSYNALYKQAVIIY